MVRTTFTPMALTLRREPFDSRVYIYELKHDGFRALAHVQNGKCRLISKNGNEYKSFGDLCAWIGQNLKVRNAILDCEIVCFDKYGRSVFNHLFFRRGLPYL